MTPDEPRRPGLVPDDLVAFLLARLDEHAAAARAATPGPWHWVDPGGAVKSALVSGPWSSYDGWETVLPVAGGDRYPSSANAAHIALHDPARVLADIAAKRRIIELHVAAESPDTDEGRDMNVETCGHCMETYPCPTLRLLALPYAEHDDYRQEWAL